MPRTKREKRRADAPLAPVPDEILDQFVAPERPMSPRSSTRPVRRFKKAMIERMLGRRADAPSGLSAGWRPSPTETTNHRNGTSGKTVLTDDGALAIEVPRDREGTFEPQLIRANTRGGSPGSTTRFWRSTRAA